MREGWYVGREGGREGGRVCVCLFNQSIQIGSNVASDDVFRGGWSVERRSWMREGWYVGREEGREGGRGGSVSLI